MDDFPYSSSQLQAAGDRIRRAVRASAAILDADRAMLSEYRAWHYPALREGQERLRRVFYNKLKLDPEIVDVTARPLKTEDAIVAKLVREQTRLNRMQDIAGARIKVPDLELQQEVLRVVLGLFERCDPEVTKDSREKGDRQGYRALHVVVHLQGRLVEIQIRTMAQDAWAQIVESLDSSMDTDFKHGLGPADWLQWLQELSDELRKRDLGEPYQVPKTPFDEESNE